uniref:(northern house mosquito) hypothetical protein n=1 Tax=Culex pipiens TaxID=7175 RepID=A0A8D8FNE2_CULPI
MLICGLFDQSPNHKQHQPSQHHHPLNTCVMWHVDDFCTLLTNHIKKHARIGLQSKKSNRAASECKYLLAFSKKKDELLQVLRCLKLLLFSACLLHYTFAHIGFC